MPTNTVRFHRVLRASPDAHAVNPDVFATPFLASTNLFTPGSEIHANMLETMLRGDAIMPVAAVRLPSRWTMFPRPVWGSRTGMWKNSRFPKDF